MSLQTFFVMAIILSLSVPVVFGFNVSFKGGDNDEFQVSFPVNPEEMNNSKTQVDLQLWSLILILFFDIPASGSLCLPPNCQVVKSKRILVPLMTGLVLFVFVLLVIDYTISQFGLTWRECCAVFTDDNDSPALPEMNTCTYNTLKKVYSVEDVEGKPLTKKVSNDSPV